MKIQGCCDFDFFTVCDYISQGTFGSVSTCINDATRETFAVKKVKIESEGFPLAFIREIKIYHAVIVHEHIIDLIDIALSNSIEERTRGIYLVFPLMKHDLRGLINSSYAHKFTRSQTKTYFYQIVRAVDYIHSKGIIHRDLKPENILIDMDGVVKLCDFGISRKMNHHKWKKETPFTNHVVSLWYRAPELLMGQRKYGREIDTWALGCLLYEILTLNALFKGKNDNHQLDTIFSMCGTPCENNWNISNYSHKFYKKKSRLKTHLSVCNVRTVNRIEIDLIRKLLVMDPKKRISTGCIQIHDYFFSYPNMMEKAKLPKYENSCFTKK